MVRKIGKRWYYNFMMRKVRYRGVIPEAQNKWQAEKAESKIKNEIYEGRYGKAMGEKLFCEFVEESYIPWAKANKRSWRIDMCRLKPLLAFFGKKRLCEISPFLIEKYKMQRRNTPVVSKTKEKPRSIGAVNRELRLLSRVFKLAIANNEIRENPCQKVGIIKGEQGRTRYLLPDEERKLMSVLVGDREHLRAMVVLVINTGLRASEVFNLQIDHIDFHRDVIYVKRTKTDEDREVPLNDTSRELLSGLVAKAKQNRYRFLFTNPKTKKPYTTIKTAWLSACRQAGISDLRFHDLRHTFGTRAADAGVPLPAIRDVMGHKTTAMTERYAHATDEGKRKAVEAVASRHLTVVKSLSKRRAANV
jgi:integrase